MSVDAQDTREALFPINSNHLFFCALCALLRPILFRIFSRKKSQKTAKQDSDGGSYQLNENDRKSLAPRALLLRFLCVLL
jgi:hypothetical protein